MEKDNEEAQLRQGKEHPGMFGGRALTGGGLSLATLAQPHPAP